jgi:hypothetical protein
MAYCSKVVDPIESNMDGEECTVPTIRIARSAWLRLILENYPSMQQYPQSQLSCANDSHFTMLVSLLLLTMISFQLFRFVISYALTLSLNLKYPSIQTNHVFIYIGTLVYALLTYSLASS